MAPIWENLEGEEFNLMISYILSIEFNKGSVYLSISRMEINGIIVQKSLIRIALK